MTWTQAAALIDRSTTQAPILARLRVLLQEIRRLADRASRCSARIPRPIVSASSGSEQFVGPRRPAPSQLSQPAEKRRRSVRIWIGAHPELTACCSDGRN